MSFIIPGGAERPAVIKPAPQVPIAVPGGIFNILPQSLLLFRVAPGKILLLQCLGEFGHPLQYINQEPSEPDAFALSLDSNQVHAVIPVAGSEERKAVWA